MWGAANREVLSAARCVERGCCVVVRRVVGCRLCLVVVVWRWVKFVLWLCLGLVVLQATTSCAELPGKGVAFGCGAC